MDHAHNRYIKASTTHLDSTILPQEALSLNQLWHIFSHKHIGFPLKLLYLGTRQYYSDNLKGHIIQKLRTSAEGKQQWDRFGNDLVKAKIECAIQLQSLRIHEIMIVF